ncbi:ricin-type beta-trefoil lectin domain protein [Dyella sp.]|uniref:ricin-type beta-trefoil lectin domain protein n=1 Tax=Dyella sp. TaxID=1869338 RepID=UPI002ED27D24
MTDYCLRIASRCIVAACALLPFTAMAQNTFVPPLKAGTPTSSTTLDQLYYLQPHNTYAHGKDFTGWLDTGYRAVEIDVIDRGDWEKDSRGPYVAHDLNPMKANCGTAQETRLKDCFDAILGWMASHPNDTTPLLVFVDMKASWDPASAWKSDEVGMLDQYISKAIPAANIYTYTDLIGYISGAPGASPRLRLKNRGWPAIGALNRKVIVMLTGGHIGSVNQNMNGGRQWLALQGKRQTTFFCADVDAGDPSEITTKIDGMSEADSGYFFCANVKAGDHDEQVLNRSAEYRQLLHLWGSSGDFSNKDYAYAYIGVAHGVGALGMDVDESLTSTTYFTPSWIGSLPFVGVRRSLPGYFMMPTEMSQQAGCVDIKGGSYGNGKEIIQWTCTNGANNQQFVYTAEGQLRPKGNNKYCLDIKGGAAGQGKEMNLWDCDGGRSEKWYITSDGLMANHDKNQAYCMDVYGASPANGTPMKLWQCDSNDRAQRLDFRQVPDWYPTDF